VVQSNPRVAIAFIESLPSSADDGLEQAVNNNALNTRRADDESDDLDNEPESEESEDEPRNPSSKPKYYRGKSFKSQFKTLVRQIDESVDSDIPAEKRADLIIKKADLFIHLSERGFPRAVPFIAPSFPNSPDTAEIGQIGHTTVTFPAPVRSSKGQKGTLGPAPTSSL
jgi:hypothetical protein